MSNENGHFYQFGDFRLSDSEGILTRGDESVRLPRKTFDLLLVLVKNANRVIGKEELMSVVWADAYVEEANLTVHISTLRKIFAETAEKSVYIETFPRRGYRLVADVKEANNISAEQPAAEEFLKTPLETTRENLEKFNIKTGEVKTRDTANERHIKTVPDSNTPTRPLSVYKNKILVALSAMLLFVFASGYIFNKWYNKTSFASQKIVRISGTEKSVSIAISPDGEYLAHAISNAGKRSLHILHIASNSSLQLVPPTDAIYWGLTFSNEGSYVYYVKEAKESSALYKIPIIGGDEKKILDNVSNKISFSPDGNQFVFVRRTGENDTAIMIANADGGGEHVVAEKKAPEFFSTFDIAWSPNGKLIAFAEGESKRERKMQIAAINIESGEKILFSNKKWQGTDGLAWLSDNSGVTVAAFETGTAATQIWVLPYPAGEPYKITNDLNNYGSIGLTSDSKILLAGQFKLNSGIWLVNADNRIAPKAITDGKHEEFKFIIWVGDDRLLYASSVSGSRDIWLMNADGTNQKQLTSNARENIHPTISPDNRFILFSSDRAAEGTYNVWKANIDGSNPVQITFGSGEILPVVSPDGKWIIYTSGGTETPQIQRTIWKIPAEGGEPTQLIFNPSRRAAISPDGKYIACWYKEDKAAPWRVAIVPFEGGQPIKFFDIAGDSPLRWTPDGNAISYVKTVEGVSNVWNQPLNNDAPKQVTQFTTERISNFDWSKDNRLICSRESTTRDTLLISNFR